MSSDRPIFVVGCPRSGTTMLALMIHAHPRLAMPPETRFLLEAWRRRHEFGDLQALAQRRALAQVCVRPRSRVHHLGLRRGRLRRQIITGPRTLGSAIGTVFQEYARLHGKARWGDKRPLYFAEVDVLLRLFPDAQIVHVVRDGRATVASLKRMPWWPYGSVGAMATWAQSEYCARRNQRRLPADTFHVVQYEALVAGPKRVLAGLCRFLDEEFDEAMLDPHEVAEVVPEGKTWHTRLRGEVDAARIGSWREELEPWEIGLMETVLGRALRRRGYQVTGLGTRPGPLLLARYAAASLRRRAAMHLRWTRERLDAARTAYPVAARLTSGQIATPGAP